MSTPFASSSLPGISNQDPPLREWNLLATAKDRQQQRMARRLRRFGDFRWTAYRGLMA